MRGGLNPILAVDSYKASHKWQYPPGTEYVSSYVEARADNSGLDLPGTLVFGLQPLLRTLAAHPVGEADIVRAARLFAAHGVPFHEEGWRHILSRHGGRLPVEIRAVAEGTLVPFSNVVAQVVNTDPQAFWLTSYLETMLQRALWYPSTVATVSWAVKRILREFWLLTSDDAEGSLDFKLHDFGARGASSGESAALGGLAHLVNFKGTDTVEALLAAEEHYAEPMAGYSIPAAEHSTITSWGRQGEVDAYANMLEQFGGPGRLVAVVSDSYDVFHAVENLWGRELRAQVLDMGGTLVIRPDSGDPVDVVSQVLRLAAAAFGSTRNSKGFRILNPAVRVIQGDGVNPKSIRAILARMVEDGFAIDNIAFGMGGALLQKVDRDTFSWAMKASAVRVAGQWRDVYKEPVTDGGKGSKRGRLALVRDPAEGLRTVRLEDCPAGEDLLRPVFRDGTLLVEDSLAQVRHRAYFGR
ncbi:nicotinate phosphoribosyltransferase [Paramagnetospirillum magneticum]|uniref:Nicotinamide phosphoribosyltransferase n=1 Tax=Paramagnetospirillum magneticum (strain ATCC 700264 / AMB-1) TaxID=342108 RepID=Q2W3N3_PARM1|nr:nicotinate phosphoribosyltransferase [Paramagnetospirillum magneticum]BAE51542.1 Nicotinic acid phosphoribosyltransferase [Paramagnetospirillum magneticum AMB-1]